VAVDDVSFRIEAGEIFGFVGPNGAGKSTTMMIVAGLRQADSGAVTIEGRAVNHRHPDVRMMLGVVPQDLAIYADLTARENLDFFGQIYGVHGPELDRRIDRVLGQIGLEAHAREYVRTFSGGMKRRLNFGAALLHEPRLVVLDEPTVGVDPQSRQHILDCVRQLAAKGVAVIYASHYMEEVESLCRRVAIIDHGRIIASGLRQKLVNLADVTPLNGNESEVVIRRERKSSAQSTTGRMAQVLDVVAAASFEVLSIETREHNLERLFLQLTGRKLRD
jgi:ABC-2 type transport system ATP-binding protein